ncbi:hypothetical protein RFI_18393 [Reticulomyxa filosa]|uniref:Uncharacterized protein n=1 Tax=Reticulomyxa filosa TaxID=46433 RepID=X6MXU4_RETFI|nr:hypothetical protein RFI_18393 [Reticulomyxa filosa]|eukprot:ETO18850.1 hypothetical protein RFI_18393 [Reticulomyxa filosa]
MLNHHEGQVRCAAWHTTNSRLIISGGDDMTVRVWRLYPKSSPLYSHSQSQNINDPTRAGQMKNEKASKEAKDGILSVLFWLSFQVNKKTSNFWRGEHNSVRKCRESHRSSHINTKKNDASLQHLHQLLTMAASGVVCGLGVSPHFNGALVCALSCHSLNKRSCLDVYHLPHWTWNYASAHRVPLRKQMLHSDNSTTKEGVPMAHPNSDYTHVMTFDKDFVDYPSVIPLPYGARDRGLCFTPAPDIVFVGKWREQNKIIKGIDQ